MEKNRENIAEELSEEIMAELFLKINERHQPIDLRSSGNPKQHK